MNGTVRQRVLLLGTAATFLTNYLANALPLFGYTTATISDALPNAFVPAGLTFAIWGLIFLGLGVFAVYQALPGQRGPRYDRLFWPFLLGNLLNVGWLLAWHSLQLGLSVLIMGLLLLSLIWLYRSVNSLQLQGAGRWLLGVPSSLYLAWITVATSANVTAWLVSLGYDTGLAGLPAGSWSAVLLVLSGLVGAALLYRRRDLTFGLVLLWAYWGVYLAHADQQAVLAGLWLAAVSLVVGTVLGWRPRHPLTHTGPRGLRL